jgi:hypothetical protein
MAEGQKALVITKAAPIGAARCNDGYRKRCAEMRRGVVKGVLRMIVSCSVSCKNFFSFYEKWHLLGALGNRAGLYRISSMGKLFEACVTFLLSAGRLLDPALWARNPCFRMWSTTHAYLSCLVCNGLPEAQKTKKSQTIPSVSCVPRRWCEPLTTAQF